MGDLFNLNSRIPLIKPFSSVETVRSYDIGMRKSALMAYQKPAKRILSFFTDTTTEVVDVGVNTGLLSLYIGGKQPGVAVSGIEENQFLLEVAEENLSLSIWASGPGDIEFELGKLSKLPFEDNSADIVYSFSSMHLWRRPVETLKECARICKSDGVVIIEDLNRHAEEGHIAFVLQFVKEGAQEFMSSLSSAYSPSEVREMLKEAGLLDWHVYEEDLGTIISSKPLDSKM